MADLFELARSALGRPREVVLYGRIVGQALRRLRTSRSPDPDAVIHLFCHLSPLNDNATSASRSSSPNSPDGGMPAYVLVQAAVLRVFSFKDRDETREWIRILWRSICSCTHCYRGYLAARERLYISLSKTYPAKNIGDLINFIDRSEQAAILTRVVNAGVLEPVPNSGSDQAPYEYRPRLDPLPVPLGQALSPTEAYALCQVLSVPAARDLRKPLSQLFEADLDAHVLPASHVECSPGLTAVLLDEDPHLSRWAKHCFGHLPAPPKSPPPQGSVAEADSDAWQESLETTRWKKILRPWSDSLAHVATPLATKGARWRYFTFFLARAPRQVAQLAVSLFFPVALQSLGDVSLYFSDVLQCYTLALRQLGYGAWSSASGDTEYPSVILSSILENPQLRTLLETSGAESWAWDWASAHIESLTPGQAQFATAVKTLAHWTFETMQLPSVPDVLKTQAIERGVALFCACLKPRNPGLAGGDQTTMLADSVTVAQALTLYSPTLVSVALHGRLPNVKAKISLTSPASEAARTLLSRLLLIDAYKVRDAVLDLAKILQAHQSNWKKRPSLKDTKDEVDSSGKVIKRAKDIVADAAKSFVRDAGQQSYPHPQVTRGVWEACYTAVQTPSSASAAFSLLAPPLCAVATIAEPTPDVLNFAQRNFEPDSSEFQTYKVAVRRSIRAISQALDDMRGTTQTMLQELATNVSESDLNMLCAQHAGQLVQLNLSPDVPTHIGAQNMVRAASEDVTERSDCFRALILLNPDDALSGLETFLTDFVDVTSRSMEANKLAEWTVRSLADILDVLTNIGDGLLRSGTPNSLLSDATTKSIVSRHLQRTWILMARSLAVIFERTTTWSHLLDRTKLVPWFRDVNLFATEMIEQLQTVQDAGAQSRPPLPADQFTLAMVTPLQRGIGWLRINDSEIMHETLSFVQQALLIFSTDLPLPITVKVGMLQWVTSQMAIQDASKRSTLLTIHQLAALKHQIKFGRAPEVVELDKEEDDGAGDVQEITGPEKGSKRYSGTEPSVKRPSSQSGKTSSWWDKAVSTTKAASGRSPCSSLSPVPDSRRASSSHSASAGKTESKQQTLNFSSPLGPFAKADKVELNLTRPPSAGSLSAQGPGAGQPLNKMQQMRQQFRSTHIRAPPHNARPIARAQQGPAWEVPEKAPVATTTAPILASALGTRLPAARATRHGQSSDSSSSSSSDDDSDDDQSRRGIDALRPGQPRNKTTAAAKIKMIEDDGDARRREQEELERKRRLRAAPDLTLLHKAILSWDLSSQSDVPPLDKLPTRVPKHFASPMAYMETFGPLLQMECWSQLQQSKEQYDERRTVSVEITSRSVVDGFVDVNAVYTSESQNSQVNLSDTDLVFFRSQASSKFEVLAKVHSYRRHPRGNQVVFRLFLRNQGHVNVRELNTAIAPRTRWEAGSLFSLSTFHRETVALLVSQYLDLREEIYSGVVSPRAKVPASDLVCAQKAYQLNEPQSQAVLGALSTQGFSLIQGPPGTGKTKTIVALVAKFLSSRPPQPKAAGGKPPPARAKILICAPSNAAIDEIVRRLKDGVPSGTGDVAHPTVIRLGREDSINSEVKDVSLELLVERALSTGSGGTADTGALREELKQLQQQRQILQAEMDTAKQAGETAKATAAQTKLRSVMAKRMTVMSKLDDTRDAQRAQTRERDAERRRMRAQIVLGADIVCSTLSGAGQETIAALNIGFETVVIDEAAQAVELSTLIPLRYGCKRCILVGDPHQLPPTVISKPAEKAGYSQSLFVRLFDPNNVYLLSIQYRMHPTISKFPSASFYEGKLQDGPNMAAKTERVWHGDTTTPPFFFFDVGGAEAAGRSHSFVNRSEAQVAVALYERLLHFSPKEDFAHRIGVVTSYKAQVDELRGAFAAKYGWDITTTVDFGTVDGFQGQEKDIIILSLVRSSSIGFLADMRRMNVALTRARASLFVLGNAGNLRKNSTWGALIDAARSAKLIKRITADEIRRMPLQRPRPGTKPASSAARISVEVAKVNPIDVSEVENLERKRLRPSHSRDKGAPPTKEPPPTKKRAVAASESKAQDLTTHNPPSTRKPPFASKRMRSPDGNSSVSLPSGPPRIKEGEAVAAQPSVPMTRPNLDPPAPKDRKSGPSKMIMLDDDDRPTPKKPRVDVRHEPPTRDSPGDEAVDGPPPASSIGRPPPTIARPTPDSGAAPKKSVSKASRAAVFARGRR